MHLPKLPGLLPDKAYRDVRGWHLVRDKAGREVPVQWQPSPISSVPSTWICNHLPYSPEFALALGWTYIGAFPHQSLNPVAAPSQEPDEIHPEYNRMHGDIEE